MARKGKAKQTRTVETVADYIARLNTSPPPINARLSAPHFRQWLQRFPHLIARIARADYAGWWQTAGTAAARAVASHNERIHATAEYLRRDVVTDADGIANLVGVDVLVNRATRKRGKRAAGVTSGSRLLKYICGCRRVGTHGADKGLLIPANPIRAATEHLDATCNKCGQRYQLDRGSIPRHRIEDAARTSGFDAALEAMGLGVDLEACNPEQVAELMAAADMLNRNNAIREAFARKTAPLGGTAAGNRATAERQNDDIPF